MIPFLTALAVVAIGAAIREIHLARELGGSSPMPGRMIAGNRSAAAAALRLGLPERLRRAGLDDRVSIASVLGAKSAGGAIGWGLGLLFAPLAPGRLGLLIVIGLPLAGFWMPDLALERRARRRRRRLIAALPDALDLLAVGATTGRSPLTGFDELSRSAAGPLASELALTVAEVECGVPQSRALRALWERSRGSELAALCAAIERSSRLGSPLADHLHRQSASVRSSQRRVVEEGAARAAPKIQLVVALILVPSVLLMIVAGLIANSDRLLSGL